MTDPSRAELAGYSDRAQFESSRDAHDSSTIASLRVPWWRRVGLPAFCLSAGLAGAVLAMGAGHREIAVRIAFVSWLFGILFGLELHRRRVLIRRDGVEVRGLFQRRHVRFDALTAFTYDVRTYRLYLPIPIGRIARLTLAGPGQQIVFHGGFAQFDRYAPLLVNLAVEATVARMRAAIDRGERARFGSRIAVDRAGLRLSRRLGKTIAVDLDQLHLDIADGKVFISTGERRLATLSLRGTPNLLALPQLVQELAVNRSAPRPDALLLALAMGR